MKRVLLIATMLMLITACHASDYKVERFQTPNNHTVAITLIKHGSLAISFEGYEIQIDPVAPFGLPTDYTQFPKADLILVTHEHGDHLNAETIETLTKEGTCLLLNQTSFDQIGKGTVIRNGESRNLTDKIRLDAVPAYNVTPEHLKFHPKGNGNGYVLTIDGLRIYIAGDTEDIEEMKELKNIDVAFLPVNQPYTMTVEQAVHAASVIKPKVLIPYHFSQTDVKQVKEQLGKINSGIDVWLRDMQ